MPINASSNALHVFAARVVLFNSAAASFQVDGASGVDTLAETFKNVPLTHCLDRPSEMRAAVAEQAHCMF